MTTNTYLESTPSELRVVEDITRQATKPEEIAPGIWAGVDRDGRVQVKDLRNDLEAGEDHPKRKKARVTLTEADSFVGHLAKHGLPESELWADVDAAKVTAIINAHEGVEEIADAVTETIPGLAGWQDHTAVLQLRRTDDWNDWTKSDKGWFTQSTFAEFVEAHLPNFASPDGATMLELAQSFRANTAVKFESSKRLSSGETKLEYREDVQAAAGKKGDITIPETFTLALQPFEHGAGYKVGARFRYRIAGGELTLGYVLDRPKDVLRDAFAGVVSTISEATTREIWHGTP